MEKRHEECLNQKTATEVMATSLPMGGSQGLVAVFGLLSRTIGTMDFGCSAQLLLWLHQIPLPAKSAALMIMFV